MSMLAYYIKPVLELVPEAMPLIKQASVDQEYPINNKSSVIASALALQYMVKIANKAPDYDEMEKVAKAVSMYGVSDEVSSFGSEMVKRAHERKISEDSISEESYKLKESFFQGTLTGFNDLEKVASEAEGLFKFASDHGYQPSDDVVRYSGNGILNKEAALKSLSVRYNLTKEATYIKLAYALGKKDSVSNELTSLLCKKVSYLDKKAGISAKGFNFYKEAFFTKEAEAVSVLKIKLGNKQVPYESIARVGRGTISKYIGEDIAKEFDKGPANFKQVAETLPLDLQTVLLSLTKNV